MHFWAPWGRCTKCDQSGRETLEVLRLHPYFFWLTCGPGETRKPLIVPRNAEVDASQQLEPVKSASLDGDGKGAGPQPGSVCRTNTGHRSQVSHLAPSAPVGTNRAGARKDTSWMSLRSGGEHRGQHPNLPPPSLPRVKPRKGKPGRKDRDTVVQAEV